jgi:hypothetical protein
VDVQLLVVEHLGVIGWINRLRPDTDRSDPCVWKTPSIITHPECLNELLEAGSEMQLQELKIQTGMSKARKVQ